MQHRSVASAAQELGVTASAVSHALGRLRYALKDELFVYGDSGMVPTPRAMELAPNINKGLGLIASAVNPKVFNPAETLRTFRIASSDNTAVTLLPHLVGRLAVSAPLIDFRFLPLGRTDIIRQLDEGHVDMVVGWFGDLPDRMRRATVTTDSEAIVVRVGHPLTKQAVTRESLFSFPHIVVELMGTEDQAIDGFVDERGVMRRVWIERLLIETAEDGSEFVGRVAISVPHFNAVAPMLQQTDLIATLPRRLALHAASLGSLVCLEMPYNALEVPIEAIWHQRSDEDAGLKWLLKEFREAVDGI